MNACIKTGANVYLPEYGFTVHGDLFELGDVYVLHTGGRWRECLAHESPSFNLGMYRMVEMGHDVIACEKQFCTDFNYIGWTK